MEAITAIGAATRSETGTRMSQFEFNQKHNPNFIWLRHDVKGFTALKRAGFQGASGFSCRTLRQKWGVRLVKGMGNGSSRGQYGQYPHSTRWLRSCEETSICPSGCLPFARSIKGDRDHRPAAGTPTLRQLAPSRCPATAATGGKTGTADTLWILLNSDAASPTKLALYAHHLKHEHSHLCWQMGSVFDDGQKWDR